MRSIIAISAALILPGTGVAAEPIRLQPSSKWYVDYAENSCRLIRTFGEGRDMVTLLIDSPAPGETDMVVTGKVLATSADSVAARFLPVGGKTFKGSVVKSAKSGDPGLMFSDIRLLPDATFDRLEEVTEQMRRRPLVRPPATTIAEKALIHAQRRDFTAKATHLEVRTRSNRSVVLETGSLGEPIAAFDKCASDSLKDWGVDPEVEAKIVRTAWAPNPQSWFSEDDYPTSMIREGQQADVRVRVLVDATGAVTKCTSFSYFKEKSFNDITCAKFTSRARFAPAELADGTKVPSYYITRVVFRMM